MGQAEPYADIDDLPEKEVDGYSKSQKAAFKRAWNRAAEKEKDERTALREAHAEAKQASDGST